MTKNRTETYLNAKNLNEALKSIVGLPLRTFFRAADMRMFGFGEARPYKGGHACDYSLHILCSWRLLGPQGIITGHRDLWGPINEDDWDEEWDYENGNLQDEKLLKLFDSSLSKPKFFVENAQIKNCGDLEIFLSGGYKFETFLNHSSGDSWLIFQPGDLNSFFHMDQDLSRLFFSSEEGTNYDHFCAAFRIMNIPHLHGEITQNFGKPSFSSLEQKKSLKSIWTLDSPLPETAPLSDHLLWLSSKLQPHKKFLNKLRDSGAKMDIFCGYRSGSSMGFDLENTKSIQLFAELDLPLRFSCIIA